MKNLLGLQKATIEIQKVLLGNPFPIAFYVDDIFATIDSSTTYTRLENAPITTIKHTIYIYDAVGTDVGNYVAKDTTPGFTDTIEAGIGFWIGIAANGGSAGVGIDMPYSVK